MADGTEEDEDVPYGVVVALGVLCKEVCADGVEQSFGEDEQERGGGELLEDGFGYEDSTPSHEEVEGE